MKTLNPTLWRTCRMLSGKTRIRLMRELQQRPGQNVTSLAEAVGIGVSDASQELRRIQSRGLLQADRRRAQLIYRFGADPQVPSAAPILKALRTMLSGMDAAGEERLRAMTYALAHPRRIAILQALIRESTSAVELHRKMKMHYITVLRHMQPLLAGGWIHRDQDGLRYLPQEEPLAKALVQLLPPEGAGASATAGSAASK